MEGDGEEEGSGRVSSSERPVGGAAGGVGGGGGDSEVSGKRER